MDAESNVINDPPDPREGWDEKFRLMAENGDDRLLDDDSISRTEWDKDEWEW